MAVSNVAPTADAGVDQTLALGNFAFLSASDSSDPGWEEDRSSNLLMDEGDDAQDPGLGPPHLEGYEVRELLGEGGMGVVWRAIQLHSRRAVALKIVSSLRLSSPTTREI